MFCGVAYWDVTGCPCVLPRPQIAELEAENADLRTELNAFDPSFWDEVMSLKAQHGQLTRKVAQYEDMITDLSARLGIPPPLGGQDPAVARAGVAPAPPAGRPRSGAR